MRNVNIQPVKSIHIDYGENNSLILRLRSENITYLYHGSPKDMAYMANTILQAILHKDLISDEEWAEIRKAEDYFDENLE